MCTVCHCADFFATDREFARRSDRPGTLPPAKVRSHCRPARRDVERRFSFEHSICTLWWLCTVIDKDTPYRWIQHTALQQNAWMTTVLQHRSCLEGSFAPNGSKGTITYSTDVHGRPCYATRQIRVN